MKHNKRNMLFSIFISVFVMLYLGAPAFPDTYYYGLEIQDNLVGYMEINIVPGSGADSSKTIIESKMFIKLTLMGQPFDSTILETFKLSADSGLPVYYKNNITQGSMKTGVTVSLTKGSALFKYLSGKDRTIPITPDTIVGNPPFYYFLIKDMDISQKEWKKSYPVLDTEKGEVSPVTYILRGSEKLILAGKTFNTFRFELQEKHTGVSAQVWINREDGRILKAESPNNKLYEADATVIGQIKRAELDDLLFARVNTLIVDYRSISYMKVKAKILSLGEEITPESLNVPGQHFTGSVKDSIIEGIFEIQHQHYNGEDSPPFPSPTYTDSALSKFLEPEEQIESDDPVLIQKAKQLTKGSSNSWEASRRLAKWVAEHILYEIPGGSARHTYDTGKGECGSHSRLFIAFCRAAGIPARMATGCMYTPNFNGSFGQHAWNEVYMGEKAGWIPIDTTVNEIEYVDSGHIRLGNIVTFNPKNMEILDYKAKSIDEIQAYTLGAIKVLPWDTGKTYTYEYIYKGYSLGTETFTIKQNKTNEKGEKIYTADTGLDLQGVSTTGKWEIDSTCIPINYNINGKIKDFDFSINCIFSPGQVVEKAVRSSTPIERTIPFKGQVYLLDNNNMSLFAILFAAIPLEEGKAISLKIFHPASMMILPLEIKVNGKEPVTIDSKEYSCRAIDANLMGVPFKLWVDESGRLVKSEQSNGNLHILLKN